MNNEIISAWAQELSGSEAENILKLFIPHASYLFFDSRFTTHSFSSTQHLNLPANKDNFWQ